MNNFEENEYEQYLNEWEKQFANSNKSDKRGYKIEMKNPQTKQKDEMIYFVDEYDSKIYDWAKDEIEEQTHAEQFVEKVEDLIDNIYTALQDLLEFVYDKYDA